jgi:hypothetical protein
MCFAPPFTDWVTIESTGERDAILALGGAFLSPLSLGTDTGLDHLSRQGAQAAAHAEKAGTLMLPQDETV